MVFETSSSRRFDQPLDPFNDQSEYLRGNIWSRTGAETSSGRVTTPGTGRETEMLCFAGLDKALKPAEAKLPADSLESAGAKKSFDKLSEILKPANKDELSLDELGCAVGKPSIKGEPALFLAVLKSRFDKFEQLDPSEDKTKHRITAKSMERFEELVADVQAGKCKDKDKIDFVNDILDTVKSARETVQKSVRTLYANPDKPLESIKTEAVKQAFVGNCYFFGALAALTEADPKAIEKMIKPNKDGTFTVTFPKKKPITVDGISDAELVLFPKPGQFGTWVGIMEKAYGQYCTDNPSDKLFRKLLNRADSKVAQENTEGPSLVDGGLRILTGKGMDHVWNNKPDDMHKMLTDMMKETPRRPITTDSVFNVKTGDGAAVWAHTYSVLEYKPDSKTVIARNPWGFGTPTSEGVKDLGDGKFSMNLDVFCKLFSRISYPDK